MPIICYHKTCDRPAKYSTLGTAPKFCNEHRAADHINVTTKKCIHPGCLTLPTFGFARPATHCSKHRLPGQFDVLNKKCKADGCSTVPNYGPIGGKAIYCNKHAPADYVDIKHKKCSSRGCKTRPTFGPPGGQATTCAKHIQPGFIDVANIRCQFAGCINTQPRFGPAGGKAIFCGQHRMNDHVNLSNNRKCRAPGCKKHASYGEDKIVFCKTHALPSHRDLSHKHCSFPGCKLRAGYGKEKADRCYTHRNPGDGDLAHDLCEAEDCTVRASYGRLFAPKTRCYTHRTGGMLKNNCPTCSTCGIDRPAYTNRDDNIPLRCDACKLPDDQNVALRQCDTCKEMNFINDDLVDCDDCFYWRTMQPHKEREVMVKNILDDAKIAYTTYNQIPDGSCNLYRPDFTIDCGTHMIVLEVDENQHRGYPEQCERIRMFNIFQDCGMKTVFIRFNPDNYTDIDGIKRGWTPGRANTLIDILARVRATPPNLVCSVTYIYYDGYTVPEFEEFTYETVKIEKDKE